MYSKRNSFIQTVNPKLILKIIIFALVFWVMAKPLRGIGENIYYFLGSLTNKTFESISQSKYSAEKLMRAEKLTKKQSKLISQYKIKLHSLENQNKEVNKLRSLLDLKKQLDYKTISASIIGRSSDNWHKQVILDKGTNQHIMIGNSVLSNRGVVGQVVETGKSTSVVELVSDPSFRLGCKLSKKNIYGILTGKTNSVGILEFIPIGTDIRLGDIVVTSGISSAGLFPSYPAGHPIGRVSVVSKKKSKSSDLYIEVKLSENFNTINEVLVFSPN